MTHPKPAPPPRPLRARRSASPIAIIHTWERVEGPSAVVVAWCADGETATESFLSGAGATEYAELRAFEYVCRRAARSVHGPVTVYVRRRELRDRLLMAGCWFEAVRISAHWCSGSEAAPLLRLIDIEVDKVSQHYGTRTHMLPAYSHPRPHLEVATDASAQRRTTEGYAIAYVTENGLNRSRWLMTSECSSVPEAELYAIRMAVRELGGDCDLTVFSDSQCAVLWINDPEAAPSKHRYAARKLAERVERGTLRVQWVRGHSDHALNLLADRLAVAERRGREFGATRQVRRMIAANIAAEVTASVA